jgi:threonine/homoserine/homoserine lactone efflux protein
VLCVAGWAGGVRGVQEPQALALFMFVAAVTPGPNDALLSACGLQFGFARALPHVVGTTIGMGLLGIAGEVGVGAALAAAPGRRAGAEARPLRLSALGRVPARSRRDATLESSRVARPFRVHEAAAFQFVNPKSILFAVAAVATFRPAGLSAALAGVLVVTTIMLVVLVASALWAAGGTALARLASARLDGDLERSDAVVLEQEPV